MLQPSGPAVQGREPQAGFACLRRSQPITGMCAPFHPARFRITVRLPPSRSGDTRNSRGERPPPDCAPAYPTINLWPTGFSLPRFGASGALLAHSKAATARPGRRGRNSSGTDESAWHDCRPLASAVNSTKELVHYLGALDQNRPELPPVDDLRRSRAGVPGQPGDLLHRHARS
jgi:hypothetical protein